MKRRSKVFVQVFMIIIVAITCGFFESANAASWQARAVRHLAYVCERSLSWAEFTPSVLNLRAQLCSQSNRQELKDKAMEMHANEFILNTDGYLFSEKFEVLTLQRGAVIVVDPNTFLVEAYYEPDRRRRSF